MLHSSSPVFKKRMRGALYEIALFVSLCASVVAFFVGSFASSIGIDGLSLALLYATGSVLSIAGFVCIPKLIELLGTKRVLLGSSIVYTCGLFGTALASSFTTLLIPFTLVSCSFGVLLALLDIYLEHSTDHTHREGDVRGVYLGLSNLAYIAGPLLGGLVLTMGGYSTLFIASTLFMLPALGIMYEHLSNATPPTKPANHSHIRHAGLSLHSLARIWGQKSLRDVYVFYFLLRIFFALFGIYIAIFLGAVHGFSYAAIGLLIAISLVPMVVVEMPVGHLLDTSWHHNHVGVAGFGILALCAAMVPFIESSSFVVWALILFSMRVGAALAEIVAETYFFSLAGSDTQKVGLFRALYPISFLIGPALGAASVALFGYSGLFTFLSLLGLYGAYVAHEFKDTRAHVSHRT